MKVTYGVPKTGWDEMVGAQGGHFLQTQAWARFQKEVGREVLSASGTGWSWLASVRQVTKFRYLYVAYGPTIKSGGLKAALESLEQVAGELKADFVRLEPFGLVSEADLKASGFRLRPIEEIEPAMTSIVDLKLSLEDLRHNLSSGHRSAINAAERRGISIRKGDESEVSEFIRLIKHTAQRNQIRVHDAEYFNTMMRVLAPLGAAKLYVAEAEGEVIAATIIYCTDETWYYAHAASDPAYLKLQAGVPLLWRAVLDAKSAGAATFDLWGVVPDGDTSGKAGYSRFKRAFGGSDKEFAGTWDLIIKPSSYAVFQLGRKASHLVRKVRRG